MEEAHKIMVEMIDNGLCPDQLTYRPSEATRELLSSMGRMRSRMPSLQIWSGWSRNSRTQFGISTKGLKKTSER